MNRPDKNNSQPNVIDIDPVTLAAVVAAALLIPLLLSGFLFQ